MKGIKIAGAAIALVCVAAIGTGGVAADWTFEEPTQGVQTDIQLTASEFSYGYIYITASRVVGGSYANASVLKTSETGVAVNLQLNEVSSSTVVAEITFYNSTDLIYYYDKTETVASSNESISYTVGGIAQEDAVQPKTYKTITLEFSYAGGNTSNSALVGQLNFLFTADKDSIGEAVANNAVERFEDVLNNLFELPNEGEESYNALTSAMDERSGYNKASAITYIGNVAGAGDGDSETINALFDGVLDMDLDGDGNTEPVTMIIKRENVDGKEETGDDYSYTTTSWLGGQETKTDVYGVEMTLYITADDFSNVSSGSDVVVYAATYTILEGATEWTLLLPLTKGTATANNYEGWGSANSFNTDTWRSEDGQDIEELIAAL